MKVLLTGGGTAGHINPALAIAETFKQNLPNSEIAFVGIRAGKEAELVPKEGYHLYFVESMGIKRSLSLRNIKALYLALTSPYSKKTTDIIRNFQPDIVIGTGGYACWPIMAAAARMGIPTAVHESNAVAGLAVRKLQNKVDEVWLNFEKTADQLTRKEGVLTVGNPLRRGFGSISKEEARRKLGVADDKTVILSFGGSLGAERVNEAVLQLMKDFSSQRENVIHYHASGKGNFEEMKRKCEEAGVSEENGCFLFEYFYDMPYRMAAADLVICRAGAMTISELALMKKTAVLIPSPNVVDNHQYKNALALAEKGAAELIEENELESGKLLHSVTDICNSPERRNALEAAISRFADGEANKRIFERIKQLTK